MSFRRPGQIQRTLAEQVSDAYRHFLSVEGLIGTTSGF
jgi:hypothetical protein